MARIAGVELNENWKLDYALTRIKGIGWTSSTKILTDTKLDTSKRIKDLSVEDQNKISAALEKYLIEGDLARKVRTDIVRLQSAGTYRGMRHSRGLPSRGQRTKSNSRTKKGKRKTVGAFKKEVLAKMTATSTAKK
ncbi:30S ribosomal protein S13 [Candidatus Microgenomates bacterium]|nr:30S ribosomal protein S13 [Candidatus Microgenomates bacterium]